MNISASCMQIAQYFRETGTLTDDQCHDIIKFSADEFSIIDLEAIGKLIHSGHVSLILLGYKKFRQNPEFDEEILETILSDSIGSAGADIAFFAWITFLGVVTSLKPCENYMLKIVNKLADLNMIFQASEIIILNESFSGAMANVVLSSNFCHTMDYIVQINTFSYLMNYNDNNMPLLTFKTQIFDYFIFYFEVCDRVFVSDEIIIMIKHLAKSVFLENGYFSIISNTGYILEYDCSL